MEKECVTHHHACDCREVKHRIVAAALLTTHDATWKYCEDPYCHCDACEVARELLEPPSNNGRMPT